MFKNIVFNINIHNAFFRNMKPSLYLFTCK